MKFSIIRTFKNAIVVKMFTPRTTLKKVRSMCVCVFNRGEPYFKLIVVGKEELANNSRLCLISFYMHN